MRSYHRCMTSAPSDAGTDGAARVVVVDLDRRVQQSVADVLRLAGVDVVGTAGDPRAALDLIETEHPTVMLMDPRLPDIAAGDALLSTIELGWPALRVVLMGWPDANERPPRGSVAFVSKSAQPEDFVAATLAACRC